MSGILWIIFAVVGGSLIIAVVLRAPKILAAHCLLLSKRAEAEDWLDKLACYQLYFLLGGMICCLLMMTALCLIIQAGREAQPGENHLGYTILADIGLLGQIICAYLLIKFRLRRRKQSGENENEE